MDAHAILNEFVVSAHQFEFSKIENNITSLKRHLDVVIELAEKAQFSDELNPQHLVVADSYFDLINIILNNPDRPGLIWRVVRIFRNLAKNPFLLENLQTKFRLPFSLVLFLHNYGLSTDDKLVIECLNLLEVVTEALELQYIETPMENLLTFLLSEIDNESELVHHPALHILSNLCRRNKCVRTYIIRLPDATLVYKSLVSKLCNKVYTTVIYAMSILAFTTYDNYTHKKFFNHKHIIQAFELIVHLLATKDEPSAEAALNLLLDFSEVPHIFKIFAKYEKLERTIFKVINSCTDDTPNCQVARCLRYLWIISKPIECQVKVFNILYPMNKTSDSEQSDITHGKDFQSACIEGRVVHPILMRASLKNESPVNDSLLYALKILKATFQVPDHEFFQSAQPSIMEFAKGVLGHLSYEFVLNSPYLKKQLELCTAAFDFIFMMIKRMSLQDFIFKNMDKEICEKIIVSQFTHNCLSFETDNWNETGVDLLLSVLGVVIGLSDSYQYFKELSHKYFEDVRLLPFLAFALSSQCKVRIFRSLFIITGVSSYSLIEALGESISMTNTLRQKKLPHDNVESSSSQFSSVNVSREQKGFLHQEVIERKVTDLLERFKYGGIVRDIKTSEILDLFDYKIALLNKKEDELHSSILAKSEALQQADRVLSQYKCEESHREAETVKLRMLLKESELNSERSQHISRQAVEKQKELESEVAKLQVEVQHLDDQNYEKKEALSELHDRLSHQKLERENDRRDFYKQLKEKETEKSEIIKQLRASEATLKRNEIAYGVLSDQQNALQAECNVKDQDLAKQQKELRLLNMVCKQREDSIADKEGEIEKLAKELEKLRFLKEKIHQLSGGKDM